jgi:hypothetical protein
VRLKVPHAEVASDPVEDLNGLRVTSTQESDGDTTGDEVLQLRALQLSDRWAPAVQRATRPLAKPVQIAVGVYAATSTRTAPVTGGQGARGAA